jgi:hypothetical protein
MVSMLESHLGLLHSGEAHFNPSHFDEHIYVGGSRGDENDSHSSSDNDICTAGGEQEAWLWMWWAQFKNWQSGKWTFISLVFVYFKKAELGKIMFCIIDW